ncbi:hypothetical protein X915_gp047 [Bacillus phage vB_BanS-Tsamsa]|uniref:Uncharacterized protein n=1 Tax=Bacillus phage vB_BanS-Tsamsa TaxID=1308863 RepID=U5J9J2_9CAUD|nr:hypothetical protein X915_gp047 [Bacillus phage vB_BanS-Tsamsa]AGI11957.1 hypothetical protein [Bacillus phage vB_BanS-Tsamsa]
MGFKLVCNTCGESSDVKLDLLFGAKSIDIDGKVDVTTGDWEILKVECECGNKLVSDEF